jgi:hypothetical protein
LTYLSIVCVELYGAKLVVYSYKWYHLQYSLLPFMYPFFFWKKVHVLI